LGAWFVDCWPLVSDFAFFDAFLDFLMDRRGSFLRFLAYCFGRFLSLFADSLGGLFRFSPTVSAASLVFSPAVSSPFLTVSPAFFRSVLYSSIAPSCASVTSAVAATKVITRVVIFMTASFSFGVSVQIKRMKRRRRVHRAAPGGTALSC
jgi:hypothetical protein